ncbi:MAG: bifunctional riboflavin kinase/FAD synthetase [Thermoguttaceae bacterium]
MQVFRDIDSLPDELRGAAISIGKFDGVHAGHELILQRLMQKAQILEVPTLVLTFDPPPQVVLRPDLPIKPICTLSRKLELIEQFGVDVALILTSTYDLLQQTAETFFISTCKNSLKARCIVEGHSFTFGRDRQGKSEFMRSLGCLAGIDVEIVAPVRFDDAPVSSSRIRRLIQSGEVAIANEMMSQKYRLTGKVIHGDARGRTLGFPTANLSDIETILPKPGIYATYVYIDETIYQATTHIGGNPTFHQLTPKIEVFVHDFGGDLYGKTIHVDFVKMLREIACFDSVSDLVRQMNLDVEQTRYVLRT